MIFAKAFKDFLEKGIKNTEAIAEDSIAVAEDKENSKRDNKKNGSVDLQEHDARFHNGYYDGKGTCKYREALAKGDNADKLDNAEKEEETAKKTSKDIADALAAVTGSGSQFFDVPEGSKGEFDMNIIKWYGTPFSQNSFTGGERNDDGSWTAHLKNKDLAEPLADWLNHAYTNINAVANDGDVIISDKGINSAKASNAPTPQDYTDLSDIRDRLERVARLLNGRTGNLQALQASSRWNDLDNYPASNDFNRLSQLQASSDPAIAKAANDLSTIANNISASKASGWTIPAGMVPSASSMPQPAGSTSQQATSNTSSFTPDDALAILGRLAKSLNHHIDTGDFTPNAGAVAKYQAHKADIAALKDPQLDKFASEIDASLAANNQTKVSKVPPPSQAWIQAHQPKMPSGGLLGLLGAMFGAQGMQQNANNQTPTTKKNPWTPFSAKSPWEAKIQAANANHPAATNANWFKDQADKLTPQQAVQDMEARGDIVKGGYRDALDSTDPDEQELWAGWSPSKKLSDDTARCCSVCFEDLRKRFPNMPWKTNLELRCGTKPMTGGQSTHTQDWRRHTVLFNCDYGNIWPSTGLGKSNYGHNDARFPFDVLRHEMGHALISGQLPNGKRMISKWHDAMTAAYGNPAKDLEAFAGRYVSSYAVTQKGKGFSMAECLSECFSLATSPDYQPGYLPPAVEDFIFKEMLGM